CASSSVTGMFLRASSRERIIPAGPPPTMQQPVCFTSATASSVGFVLGELSLIFELQLAMATLRFYQCPARQSTGRQLNGLTGTPAEAWAGRPAGRVFFQVKCRFLSRMREKWLQTARFLPKSSKNHGFYAILVDNRTAVFILFPRVLRTSRILA